MEIDGIPLTGNISAISPNAVLENGRLRVTWKAASTKGNTKIWLTTTNNFKEGRKDEYHLVATVPLAKQEAVIDVSNKPSSFYKVVIEMPENMLNRWIVKDN